MTIPTDYTREQWKLILSAPISAALLVGHLDDPAAWVNEANAVFNLAEVEDLTTQNVLIRAISETLLATEGSSLELPADLPPTPAAARAYLIVTCRQAADTIAQKSAADGDVFRHWLVKVAERSAASTKEGGFLGFGGTRISSQEREAIHELATALGIAG
jgi:hypothetical protein